MTSYLVLNLTNQFIIQLFKFNENTKWVVLILVVSYLAAFLFSLGQHFFALVFTTFMAIMMYTKEKTVANKARKKYAFLNNENDFTNSLIQLMSAVIKLNKKQTEQELRFVEHTLKNHFSEQHLLRLMNQIKTNLQKETISITGVCKLVRVEFHLASKVQLMHLLIGICAADGVLTKKEDEFLRKIAIEIRIPFTTYKSILNMFRFKHEGQEQKRKNNTYSSASLLKSAFAILGVPETAQESEIKKAYRKLAIKHHPDKVAHLGEEVQSASNEQFLIISEAYELIKKKKGFN